MHKHIAGWSWWGALALVMSCVGCASEGSDAPPGAGQNGAPSANSGATGTSGGTPAGHNDGQSGTEGSMEVCLDAMSRQPVAADEVVFDQSSVRQLVAQLGGERELPVSWGVQPFAGRNGPETHHTTGRMELTADPMSARRVDYGPSCGSQLELDATLRLRTLDGAFNGTLPGIVSGRSTGFGFEAEVSAAEGQRSLQSPAVDDHLVSEPFVAFAVWSADPPLVHPVNVFKLAGFELRRGIVDIAWRSDARDGGAEVLPAGDASTWPTPRINALDAGL